MTGWKIEGLPTLGGSPVVSDEKARLNWPSTFQLIVDGSETSHELSPFMGPMAIRSVARSWMPLRAKARQQQ